MSSILFKIYVQLFVCIVASVHSSSTGREGRLLDAIWIERVQQDANYKGSGSMAIAYRGNFSSDVGAIVAPDKILIAYQSSAFAKARVSALTRATYDNQASIDGEEYEASDVSAVPNSLFHIVKFGPLLSTSKAVIATLPSATSHPPKVGNKECIVYAYAPNKKDDNDPSHIKLGYLPLTIEENWVCSSATHNPAYLDTAKYVCGSVVSSNGSNPYCASKFALDSFMTAFCPDTSLTKENKFQQVGRVKKWCLILGYWWFGWCDSDQTAPSSPAWILTGIIYNYHIVSGCNTPNEKLIVVFAYTGNLNFS